MKKLILRLLGFDDMSILNLKQEIKDLQTTISSLKDEATAIYNKTEEAFIIITALKIDTNDELWWEKDIDMHNLSTKQYRVAHNIQNNAAIDWIKKHPSLKERKIFHGGCLGCKTPLNDGIGKCLDCHYLNWGKTSSLFTE